MLSDPHSLRRLIAGRRLPLEEIQPNLSQLAPGSAEAQRQRLEAAHLSASVRQELGDGWTLRLGPLTHGAAWAAIEAFLGPPGSRRG